MYCPKCRSEYRPGFYHCPDCDEALVYELADEQAGTSAPLSSVGIFSTLNSGEVILIQSLLEAEGIAFNFKGDLFLGSGVFVTPSVLFVPDQDKLRVVEILRDNGLVD